VRIIHFDFLPLIILVVVGTEGIVANARDRKERGGELSSWLGLRRISYSDSSQAERSEDKQRYGSSSKHV